MEVSAKERNKAREWDIDGWEHHNAMLNNVMHSFPTAV